MHAHSGLLITFSEKNICLAGQDARHGSVVSYEALCSAHRDLNTFPLAASWKKVTCPKPIIKTVVTKKVSMFKILNELAREFAVSSRLVVHYADSVH